MPLLEPDIKYQISQLLQLSSGPRSYPSHPRKPHRQTLVTTKSVQPLPDKDMFDSATQSTTPNIVKVNVDHDGRPFGDGHPCNGVTACVLEGLDLSIASVRRIVEP